MIFLVNNEIYEDSLRWDVVELMIHFGLFMDKEVDD
jgi:hypothetical protein